MPSEERRARRQALLASVLDHDVDRWQREFLAALRGDDDVMGTFQVRGARTRPRRQWSEIAYSGPPTARLNPVRKSRGRMPA
jgi:trehalose-6-phosphate synthase